MPLTERNDTTSSDTLQGWKEIANYLGRSVRAAQRWERELGLPIRRIKTAEGQTVYATRTEIDEWVRSRDLPRPRPEDEDTSGPSSSANDEPDEVATENAPLPLQLNRGPNWITVGIVATLALIAGLFLGFDFRSPLRGPIVSIQAVGTSVTAFDEFGHVIWRTEMGQQVSLTETAQTQFASAFPRLPPMGGRDATIVVPIRFGSAPAQSDGLISFDADGKVRWKFQPQLTLTCGTQTFAGPWVINSAPIASSNQENPVVWVAFNHNSYWPSFVMEINAQGHASLRYLQAGWIRGIAEWESANGRVLAANGVLNEFELASTTLIDPAGPPVTSPHDDPRFDCTSGPTALPQAVYLWPSLDVLGPEAYAMATTFKPLADGLQVLLEQGGGGTLIELDQQRRVRSLTLPDTYWVIHRQRQAEGWIKHTDEACPERNRAMPIEEWTPETGWTRSTIVPTNRRTALKKRLQAPAP